MNSEKISPSIFVVFAGALVMIIGIFSLWHSPSPEPTPAGTIAGQPGNRGDYADSLPRHPTTTPVQTTGPADLPPQPEPDEVSENAPTQPDVAPVQPGVVSDLPDQPRQPGGNSAPDAGAIPGN